MSLQALWEQVGQERDELQKANTKLEAANKQLRSDREELRGLMKRIYAAWSREGWEPDGESVEDVMGDAIWKGQDEPDMIAEIEREMNPEQ